MSKPIFRIFVSSTYIDLIEYRKAAEKAVNDLRQKYEGMEYMGAMSEEPVKACLDLVEKCDLFIGIYAWRYGHIPEDSEFSITAQEYNEAKRLGRPCLCYFVDPKFPWLPEFIEDGQAKEKLKTFKSKIGKEHVRANFKAPDNLGYNILRDISTWLADNRPELNKAALQPGHDPVTMYHKAIAEKYSTLTMIGFKRSFAMDSIYIPLTVHVDKDAGIKCKHEDNEKLFGRTLKAEDLLTLPDKVAVVLGEPGMGKTTILLYLALRESKKSGDLFPIFVKLADFCKTQKPVETFLLSAVKNYITGASMQEAARTAIQEQKALVLLDGLDEVSRTEYNAVTERIRAFISSHTDCRVIITSRKAGFQSHEVPYRIFEIDKLPIAEIEAFVEKWFGKNSKTDLAGRITANHRIHELAQNPFLLSIICFIFEKDQNLPQRRLELYRKCAITLLTLYDEKQVSKVNGFTRRVKEQVLEDLAYYFFCKKVDEFPFNPLIEQVSKTLAAMNRSDNEEEVLREIRENSGLLQKSDDSHLFVHRTFYEYYVSCKMRSDPQDAVLSRAGEALWEEPIRLYAAQIESIEDGTQFIKKLWEKDRALALRCYPDMEKDVVEPELIKNLLNQAEVEERVALVKGLPEKISEPEKIVETLRELFWWETNGEVIYWGVKILEERKETPGALDIVYEKLDKGAEQRFKEHLKKDMVCIKAGKFKMGSTENEDEKPIHEVKLNEFFLSRYQVTNLLYEMFDPTHQQKRNQDSDQDNQPVVYVNWYEAVMFCRWLDCRLPTEAEWEYACRAGTTTPFNTGNNLTTDQANYNGNCPYNNNPKGKYLQKTTPVGSYPPNGWGLFDMHGNVFEWCKDWYDEKYYDECLKQGIIENPERTKIRDYRVLRSGGFYDNGRRCRSAARSGTLLGNRVRRIGLRLARGQKEKKSS